jgi:hypothetical protein
VGEHRHEEQELQRHPLRAGVDRPRHGQHDATADDRRVPRQRDGVEAFAKSFREIADITAKKAGQLKAQVTAA